jgi:RNA polymerase sigma factor (sigma-70 family)
MEMGSDIGVPLASTRLSLWPLPARQAKQAKEQVAKTQPRPVSKRELVFNDLYEQYYARVYAYLRFRVGSTEVAEDLVSQVFERALTHLADLQSTAAAGAWLFRIARNCAIDYFRRLHPAASLDTLLDSSHPRECSPEEVIVAQEERARLLMQLKRLPEREREVIGLKFVACLHPPVPAGAALCPA